MEKTLYLSDLDGTLLNNNALLPEQIKHKLNALIAQGMHFSLATARTAMSAHHILDGVHFKLPVGLMNGAVVYDMQKKKYVHAQTIDSADMRQLLIISRQHNKMGFLYGLFNGELTSYYENLQMPAIRAFYEDRTKTQNRKFTQIDNFADVKGELLYYVLMDDKKSLQPIYEAGKKIVGVDCVCYADTYRPGIYFLEFFSKKASKANVVRYMRACYGFTKVVGFGDNINDLPMFAVCNEAYAVQNALPEVKAQATGIIKSNEEGGVVEYLCGQMRV